MYRTTSKERKRVAWTQKDRGNGNWTVEIENEHMETRNAERNKDDREIKGNHHQVRAGADGSVLGAGYV